MIAQQNRSLLDIPGLADATQQHAGGGNDTTAHCRLRLGGTSVSGAVQICRHGLQISDFAALAATLLKKVLLLRCLAAFPQAMIATAGRQRPVQASLPGLMSAANSVQGCVHRTVEDGRARSRGGCIVTLPHRPPPFGLEETRDGSRRSLAVLTLMRDFIQLLTPS